jgi:DNA-binding HxlR family transcriptional regulator
MTNAHCSGCPINLSLEVFGDKWSLLILRDMLFGGRRHFRELLNGSQEGIASNLLANRLKRLVELGAVALLTVTDGERHESSEGPIVG